MITKCVLCKLIRAFNWCSLCIIHGNLSFSIITLLRVQRTPLNILPFHWFSYVPFKSINSHKSDFSLSKKTTPPCVFSIKNSFQFNLCFLTLKNIQLIIIYWCTLLIKHIICMYNVERLIRVFMLLKLLQPLKAYSTSFHKTGSYDWKMNKCT